MLVGIVLLIGSLLTDIAAPQWLTRFAALLTVCGAAWELLTVHAHVQRSGSREGGSE
jgi:hypothetical protein